MDFIPKRAKPDYCCQRKYLPQNIRDPYAIWNEIPCPPPWNKNILLETPWQKYLSFEDGFRILLRLSKRCNLTMPEVQLIPGRLATSMVMTSCEIGCKCTVIFTCITLLIFGLTLISYLVHK